MEILDREKSTANKPRTSPEFLGDGDKTGDKTYFSLPQKMKHFSSSCNEHFLALESERNFSSGWCHEQPTGQWDSGKFTKEAQKFYLWLFLMWLFDKMRQNMKFSSTTKVPGDTAESTLSRDLIRYRDKTWRTLRNKEALPNIICLT